MLIPALCFCVGTFAQIGEPENSKVATLKQLHLIIERSDINVVRKKIHEICSGNKFPSLVSALKDGTYKGATPYDDYNYRHEVTFEMKNGKMISIDYDEIHRDGHAKQRDVEYGKEMLQSGTTPAIAYPKYESAILTTQNLDQIDAVSGATYSLYRFRLAILYAILNSGQL
jgi:major membrane immunogen (membrane-anchored lipoprotein)